MKKLFTYTLSFFLAATVLVASTGVVVAFHICSKSKKTDVSLYEHEGCCSKSKKECGNIPAPSGQLKSNCCQLSVSYLKLDVSSLQKTISSPVDFFIPSERTVFGTNHLSPHFNSIPEIPEPDIPAKGKDLLLSIHLLLI